MTILQKLKLNNITGAKVKKAVGVTAVLAVGVLASSNAAAQNGFQGLFQNTWTQQLFAGSDFMSAIAYLAGIGFGIKAGLKLKEWNDSKGREVTLTQALIPLAIAGLLLGLPSILKAARETTSGNATGSGIEGGALRSIN